MPIDVPGIARAGAAGRLSGATAGNRDLIGDAGLRLPPLRKLNDWEKSNTSYSGCDITATINLNGKLLQIGNLSTISYSIHREKQPVRTLGRIYPKTYVRGPLTIAGTLVFTVFDEHVLAQLRNVFDYEHNVSDLQKSLLPHQFPPFDVTVIFANEYGHQSYLRIYGIDLVDEGQTHSVSDMVSENMMQYVAKDIDLMLRTSEGITHQDLTMRQALFTGDRGQNVNQIRNIDDRDRVRNQVAEYNKFIAMLEQEIALWKKLINENRPDDVQFLRIYKIGGYTTLAEAELFLQENRQALNELQRSFESFNNVHYGQDPIRDNPGSDFLSYNKN